jgi:PQQ-like domain
MNGLAVKLCGLFINAVLAAAGFPVSAGALAAGAFVSSGHRGAVLDMAEDSRRGLLFSVGEDGFLRVWDTAAGTLVRKIAVTRQMAQSVALNPSAPLAAVVVTDGLDSFAVDVWDWEAAKRLSSISIQGTPLFVRFSWSGTYLLCGATQWDSLHIFRSRDGTPVPFHPEGFGMVGFAEASRSDATLMTYQPSGRIAYWSIATGLLIKDVPTVGGLTNVRASDNRGCLVGQTDAEVVGIDALSGEIRFRMDAPGVISMDISGDTGRIACLSPDGSLKLRSTADGGPALPPMASRFDWRPHLVRMTPDAVLVAGDDGQIGMIAKDGRATELARDVLARVSSVAAQGPLLAVAAGDVIHVFHLGEPGSGTNPVTESLSVANPYSGPVGLNFLDARRLVVWKQGDGPGSIGAIDLSTGQLTRWGFSFAGPLEAVAAQDDTLFTLEKGGAVRVLNPATGEQLFSTNWPGALCLAPMGHAGLVLGSVTWGDLRSSLVRVDLRTGETAPLPGSETLTFALAPDPAGGKLYSLAVNPDGRTDLTSYEGTGLQTETVVDSAEGEFLSASLSFDPANHLLYTSLGREVVKAWTGQSLKRLENPARGTLALCALDGLLASLQRDSSVSLWDTAADESYGEIYPFADGSWAAVMADGTFFGSREGLKKVEVLVKGKMWAAEAESAAPPSEEIPRAPQ